MNDHSTMNTNWKWPKWAPSPYGNRTCVFNMKNYVLTRNKKLFSCWPLPDWHFVVQVTKVASYGTIRNDKRWKMQWHTKWNLTRLVMLKCTQTLPLSPKDGHACQENNSLLFLFHDYKKNKEYIAYTNNYTMFFFFTWTKLKNSKVKQT